MRCLLLLSTFLCCNLYCMAQKIYWPVKVDSMPYSFRNGWKYSLEDKMEFASSSFNDEKWRPIDPSLNVSEIDPGDFEGFAWFRLNIEVPPELINKPLVLAITQLGASEIYVDGQLSANYGKVSFNGEGEKRFDPYGIPLSFILKDSSRHVIAVRYSHHKYLEFEKWDDWNAGFFMEINFDTGQAFSYAHSLFKINLVLLCVAGFLFALTFMHLFFYIFYRKQKYHLYYSIFTLAFGLFFLLPYFSLNLFDPDITEPVGYFIPMAVPIYFIALAGFIEYMLLGKLLKMFWISLVLGAVVITGFFFKNGMNEIFYAILISIVIAQTFVAIGKGWGINREGAKIIGWGFLIFVLFVSFIGISYVLALTGALDSVDINQNTIYYFLPGILSIPVSISLYMAKNFATVNISLQKKLEEIEQLSAEAIEREKEKQLILSEQNIVLEEKVKIRTAEVVEQKELVLEKQKEIIDSITYARRIQIALITSEKYIENQLRRLMKS